MKILVVEDEAKVVSLIKRYLGKEGYDVTVAMDGETGYEIAKKYPLDLIILDLMLPNISGVEVCKMIRKANIATPIIMLTALGSTFNIVSGLDVGADDYMVKPFKMEELKARVRTLIRRTKGVHKEPNQIQIRDLILNQDTRTVSRAGKSVDLTATEYRLLEYMMKNVNKVLSRIEILEHVWDINFNMGTNVVDVYVNYLRKKVDKDHEQKLISTVIGMGYTIKE